MTTLNKLAAEFDAWRRGKKRRNERVPEELLARAQELARDLGASRVQRVTKLTQAQLRAEQRETRLGENGRAKAVGEEVTILNVPRPGSRELELLLPGGLMVRCCDMNVGVELIKALLTSREVGHDQCAD